MARVLVTGGAGFIGSHLVDRLINYGDEVLVVDNLSTGRIENLHQSKQSSRLNFLEADLQSEKAIKEFSSFKPDQVVHLAGQMNVRKSVEDPLFDANQNILASLTLIQCCIANEVRRIVFSSTGGAIYGEQEKFPADESHPVSPECPYGVSKRCAELYLEHYSMRNDIEPTILRFGNVYGPRQNPKGEAGVVSIFIEQLKAGSALTINGAGSQTRDFIFVSDIIDAIHLVMVSDGLKGSLYNLGTGVETSVNAIADILIQIAQDIDGKSDISTEHRSAASGEQERSLLDASAFNRDYFWTPLIKIKDGLLRTYLDFNISVNERQHPDVFLKTHKPELP